MKFIDACSVPAAARKAIPLRPEFDDVLTMVYGGGAHELVGGKFPLEPWIQKNMSREKWLEAGAPMDGVRTPLDIAEQTLLNEHLAELKKDLGVIWPARAKASGKPGAVCLDYEYCNWSAHPAGSWMHFRDNPDPLHAAKSALVMKMSARIAMTVVGSAPISAWGLPFHREGGDMPDARIWNQDPALMSLYSVLDWALGCSYGRRGSVRKEIAFADMMVADLKAAMPGKPVAVFVGYHDDPEFDAFWFEVKCRALVDAGADLALVWSSVMGQPETAWPALKKWRDETVCPIIRRVLAKAA